MKFILLNFSTLFSSYVSTFFQDLAKSDFIPVDEVCDISPEPYSLFSNIKLSLSCHCVIEIMPLSTAQNPVIFFLKHLAKPKSLLGTVKGS